jgi:hypothetical protein
MPQNTLPWTEEHEAYCYQHHIPPAAKILWQWLMRQGEISLEVEPDLSEFNTWVEKSRGKGYSHNYLKKMFELLCEHRVIQVVKQYSWKIFKLLVRPLEWLKPPRKKREKSLQNSNSTYNLPTSKDNSSVDQDIQQQHSNLILNQETLSDAGIYFDESEKKVLDRPNCEIKVSIALFKIRLLTSEIPNPEGFIRRCLEGRWWENPSTQRQLIQHLGNGTIWDELRES